MIKNPPWFRPMTSLIHRNKRKKIDSEIRTVLQGIEDVPVSRKRFSMERVRLRILANELSVKALKLQQSRPFYVKSVPGFP